MRDGGDKRLGAVGRTAAGAAVLGVVALVALVMFAPGGGYDVSAEFVNAGQLVEGNEVQMAGTAVGSVERIAVTPDGRAEIGLRIDEAFAPLPAGTRAVIRQASQSGIANRFVELRLPERGSGTAAARRSQATIPDGGRIGSDRTETAVDLDQLFNALDPRTRRALKGFLRGSARQYAGRGEQARAAFRYLNPSLAQASRVFNELSRDIPVLEGFVVDSSRLVTALAERRDRLTDLVSRLNATTRALGGEKRALASAVDRLPPFMRRANTTFVNLRGALDDVDPLVDASRELMPELRPFLAELRPFARDALPAVRGLDAVLRRRGAANDVVDLARTFTPLATAAVDRRERRIDFGTGPASVGRGDGAFPQAARALEDSTPIVAHWRPYTVDLFGWFDDFSNSGVYDAIGGVSRATVVFNATSIQNNQLVPLIGLPIETQQAAYRDVVKAGQYKRCPGAAEAASPDGSNVWSEEERRRLDCEESARATSER